MADKHLDRWSKWEDKEFELPNNVIAFLFEMSGVALSELREKLNKAEARLEKLEAKHGKYIDGA
jgi:tRNA(Phe) wybutosine-synthesizing methylase Tyw3